MSSTTNERPTSFLSRLQHNQNPYHLGFSAAVGGLIGLWVTALLYYYQANLHFIRAIDRYGHSMTGMAARQAVDATLNHDRISLQVILEDIVKQQAVTSAAIYDVENNLLVQAGSNPTDGTNNSRQYHAPINLHDSLAGHVTLSLSATPNALQSRHWTFLLLITGLLGSLAGLCWYRGRIHTAIEPADVEISTNDVTQSPRTPEVLLSVFLGNVDILYRQLNGESRNKRFEKLHNHIKKSLTLYVGSMIYSDKDRIIISFCGDAEEAALQALCCNHLIQQLNRQDREVPLTLQAHILPISNAQALINNIHNERQRLNSVSAEQTTLATELFSLGTLAQKIHADTSHSKYVIVEDFQGNYQELLQKQLTHLQGDA